MVHLKIHTHTNIYILIEFLRMNGGKISWCVKRHLYEGFRCLGVAFRSKAQGSGIGPATIAALPRPTSSLMSLWITNPVSQPHSVSPKAELLSHTLSNKNGPLKMLPLKSPTSHWSVRIILWKTQKNPFCGGRMCIPQHLFLCFPPADRRPQCCIRRSGAT